jgi:CheY-like chemotaxis protein
MDFPIEPAGKPAKRHQRLVVTRKPGEQVYLPQIDTVIEMGATRNQDAKLVFLVPEEVVVVRDDVANTQRVVNFLLKNKELSEKNHCFRGLLNGVRMNVTILQKLVSISPEKVPEHIDEMLNRLNAILEPEEAVMCLHPPKKTRAMIIEDDVNEREMLANFLRMMGIEVTACGTGEEAIERLRGGEEADVILLDMGLPAMKGDEVAKTIRRLDSRVHPKIFVVSGRPQDDLIPTDRWYQKPLNPERLLEDLSTLNKVG